MQSLKTVEHVLLTENVQKTLAQNRINTILDFLQEDTEKLSTLTKLSHPEILTIRNDIFKNYSAPLVIGSSILIKSLISKKFLSTGLKSLNVITGGGIPIGYITELCGLADSGKTQLCFQLAVNCVNNTECTVLYVDTKGDFSAIRVQKILSDNGYSHKEMAMIMFKIRIVYVWNLDELIELFKEIKNKTLVIENLSLIIVDSLPSLMCQYVGDNNKIGLTFLNILVNYSRFLCKELEMGMIFVNIQTRWVDQDASDLEDDGEHSTTILKESTNYIEKRIRCLGKYWQHIPALVLLLEKNQEKDPKKNCSCQINVKVLKSSFSECNQQCILKLSNLGVT